MLKVDLHQSKIFVIIKNRITLKDFTDLGLVTRYIPPYVPLVTFQPCPYFLGMGLFLYIIRGKCMTPVLLNEAMLYIYTMYTFAKCNIQGKELNHG